MSTVHEFFLPSTVSVVEKHWAVLSVHHVILKAMTWLSISVLHAQHHVTFENMTVLLFLLYLYLCI